jgi:transcriptional regulator with XRE-family HTH domain
MTQREVAERAGVSVDLISKLEQGQKHTALVGTLHKIAQALDVDVSALLARPARIDLEDDPQERGVLAIRQAITALWEDTEPASAEELAQSARYGWACYWTNRFDVLGGLLPAFIADARATASERGGPRPTRPCRTPTGWPGPCWSTSATSTWRIWPWPAPWPPPSSVA